MEIRRKVEIKRQVKIKKQVGIKRQVEIKRYVEIDCHSLDVVLMKYQFHGMSHVLLWSWDCGLCYPQLMW